MVEPPPHGLAAPSPDVGERNVLSRYASDRHFRRLLDRFDNVDADGMSIVFASRLQPGPEIPERVATTDFVHDASSVGARHGMRFYLLGAGGEENRLAQERLRAAYPGLTVDGRDGFFGEDETNDVIEHIRDFAPDVLWIGLGVGREQAFAVLARDRLPRSPGSRPVADCLTGYPARTCALRSSCSEQGSNGHGAFGLNPAASSGVTS